MTNTQQHQRYERLVRKLRQRIFNYYDESETKGLKASRVLDKALHRMAINKPSEPTDRWGATAQDRIMLASHGMAWGD